MAASASVLERGCGVGQAASESLSMCGLGGASAGVPRHRWRRRRPDPSVEGDGGAKDPSVEGSEGVGIEGMVKRSGRQLPHNQLDDEHQDKTHRHCDCLGWNIDPCFRAS